MINFEEELKKYKPSLEIEETEKSVREDSEKDMVDLMVELMNEYRNKR